MRKFIIRAIPIAALIIFVLIMISANFLKKPLGKDDDIPNSIQLILKDVGNENWDEASKKTDQLEKAWKKIVKRVQFSAERDELNDFDINLARLRGAIMVKDKSNASLELNEAYEHWDNIGR
ncbi:DUF4363 family protein [Clostridium swellfunianum]|uniref:DUF4363 family protein n=1 Tax=Clostridium swellfunianum TaxID=1367462 RepID=UPI00202FC0F9|nr:DUF4363 family protein [Clostridium swellfunianum]MCM0649636.1 DUF4363 family protein [Clostridium swellfunianum]